MRRKSGRIVAYIDGSSLGMYGYCIPKENIRVLTRDFPMTNNRAEYMALYVLLLNASEKTKIKVNCDSQLVVNQFRGIWKTNNPELKLIGALCQKIVALKKLDVLIIWVPRKKNTFGRFLDREKRKQKKNRERLKAKIARGYL